MRFIPSSKSINIFLLAIVLVLGAIAFFKPDLVSQQKIEPLTQVNSEQINNIRISTAQQNEVILNKDKTWSVDINEQAIPADEDKINKILQLLNTQSHTSFESPNEELEKYQLQKPRLAVKFNDTEIRFGNSEPFSNRRYIYSNNKVHLITDQYYPQLVSPVSEFVDKSLVTNKKRVTNIKIVWLQKPSTELPSNAGAELLQAWQQIKAADIEPYYHQDVIARIIIQTNHSTLTEFGLLSAKNTLKLVRKDLGIVYVVPKQFMKNLLVFSKVEKSRG